MHNLKRMTSYIERETLQNMMNYRGFGKIQWNKKQNKGIVNNIEIHVVRSLSDRALSTIPRNSIVVHSNKNKNRNKHEEFQCFHVDELQFTLVEHPCVPLHRLVTNIEEVEQQFGTCSKFPIIRKSDPVVRFYGWVVGDIIQVNDKYRIIM